VGMAIAPPRTISSAQTVANTGLWMKKSTNTFAWPSFFAWIPFHHA
jgi:hypothetical protein